MAVAGGGLTVTTVTRVTAVAGSAVVARLGMDVIGLAVVTWSRQGAEAVTVAVAVARAVGAVARAVGAVAGTVRAVAGAVRAVAVAVWGRLRVHCETVAHQSYHENCVLQAEKYLIKNYSFSNFMLFVLNKFQITDGTTYHLTLQ